jgi:hypothetical protein
MASSEHVKALLKRQMLKEAKLAHWDKLYKWFTAVCSEGGPVTGPVVIENVECFYDETKITERCILCDGWLRNFNEVKSVQVQSVNPEYYINQHLSGTMHVALM